MNGEEWLKTQNLRKKPVRIAVAKQLTRCAKKMIPSKMDGVEIVHTLECMPIAREITVYLEAIQEHRRSRRLPAPDMRETLRERYWRQCDHMLCGPTIAREVRKKILRQARKDASLGKHDTTPLEVEFHKDILWAEERGSQAKIRKVTNAGTRYTFTTTAPSTRYIAVGIPWIIRHIGKIKYTPKQFNLIMAIREK